jgi:hypothetical protein
VIPVVPLKHWEAFGKSVAAAWLDIGTSIKHIHKMPARKPLIPGERFGRLTVIGEAPPRHGSKGYNIFRASVICDCGTASIVYESKLRYGSTRSCGCLQIEVSIQNLPKGHGHARHGKLSPTYISWRSMNYRCYYPKCNGYHRYGGAGVTVCDRWRHNFEAFLADMGERPHKFTLDRIDNELGYEPGNCRWVTWRAQEGNRRNNIHVLFRGERIITAEAARRLDTPDYAFRRLAKKHGSYQAAVDMLMGVSQ